MLYIAHRGFRVNIPENSLQGLRKALQLNMDYMELDIHSSKDQVLFVCHDDTLNRTTNGKGSIRKLRQQVLESVIINNSQEPLSQLSNFFSTLRSEVAPLKLMIELKGERVETLLSRQIQQNGFENRVCVSGQDLKRLDNFHRIMPAIPLCLNITHCRKFPVKKFLVISEKDQLPLPFSMISLRSTEITPEFISKCHQLKILALCWGFLHDRCIDTMKRCIGLGIDGILFDDPNTVPEIRKL